MRWGAALIRLAGNTGHAAETTVAVQSRVRRTACAHAAQGRRCSAARALPSPGAAALSAGPARRAAPPAPCRQRARAQRTQPRRFELHSGSQKGAPHFRMPVRCRFAGLPAVIYSRSCER